MASLVKEVEVEEMWFVGSAAISHLPRVEMSHLLNP